MSKRSKPPPSEIAVHLCGPADRDEQVRLHNACFKKPIDGPALAWRYDRSPHGSSLSYLSKLADGKGVCGYACSPVGCASPASTSSPAPADATDAAP